MKTLDQLNELIRAALADALPQLPPEPKALAEARGRVLAAPVLSPLAIPAADLSAMDGYALNGDGDRFRLVGESSAGRPYPEQLSPGTAVRIMTGAVVPAGADRVAMQENVSRSGDEIVLNAPCRRGQNIRRRGEELEPGVEVLRAGKILSAADVLLLASLGLAAVPVYRPLTVALISSGDELLAAGQRPTVPGQLYDSNRPLLRALLDELPVTVRDLGIIPDQPAALEAALRAASAADAIISSGGVSVGDYDFLKATVEKLGTVASYKVKMKPGKPFVFGHIGKAVYFGLPGNPVSSFVGFSRIIRPALWQLAGADPLPPPFCLPALLSEPLKKKGDRRDFQRGRLTFSGTGWTVAPQGPQDSHRVYGLARANCLIDLPAAAGDLEVGAPVITWPFFANFLGG